MDDLKKIFDAAKEPVQGLKFASDKAHDAVDFALDKTNEYGLTNDSVNEIAKDFNKKSKNANDMAFDAASPGKIFQTGNELLHDSVDTAINIGAAINTSMRNLADKVIDNFVDDKEINEKAHKVNDTFKSVDKEVANYTKKANEITKNVGNTIADPIMNVSALDDTANNKENSGLDSVEAASDKMVKKSEEMADKGLVETMQDAIKQNPNILDALTQIITGQEQNR